jgi:hypothetical protein
MSSPLIVGIQSFRWQEKEFIVSVFFRSMVMTPRMARTGLLRWIRQRKVALMRAMWVVEVLFSWLHFAYLNSKKIHVLFSHRWQDKELIVLVFLNSSVMIPKMTRTCLLR